MEKKQTAVSQAKKLIIKQLREFHDMLPADNENMDYQRSGIIIGLGIAKEILEAQLQHEEGQDKLVIEPIDEMEIDQMASEYAKYSDDMTNIEECFVDKSRSGFRAGFKKALELLQSKF